MTPILITPPSVEPLSLVQAKAWLRIQHADEDDLVAALVVAARQAVERHTRRALLPQTWRLVCDAFPEAGLALPVTPLRSVAAVRVYTSDAVAAAVAPASYMLDLSRDDPWLRFLVAPPTPGRARAGCEVDVVAGYAADPTGLPGPLVHAVRLLLARAYESRGDADEAPPQDVAALLAPYRRARLV